MPRARNIKYETFMDHELAEHPSNARLFFIASWTIADFNGNFEWREKRLKAELMPYDEINLMEIAINLDKSGFFRFFSDGEKLYCNIPNFVKHQRPHKNEILKGTKIPDYSKDMRQLVDLKELTINHDKSRLNHDKNASHPPDPLYLIPDSLSLNPEITTTTTGNHEPEKITVDWQPDEYSKNVAEQKWAEANLGNSFINMEEVINKFINYHLIKGNLSCDWNANFRDWCFDEKTLQREPV